jgi:hypothetical protein
MKHMRLFPANFATLAATAFLQIHCKAGDDVLKDRIVRATLNHNEPALVKVGTNGVTSLEFPYRIEAIDGYGFSGTPGPGDAFQISYTKGTNYFSVRALKAGVTGNLTVVLDQKVYSLFFEESSNPSFVNIFGPGLDGGLTSPGEREVAEKDKAATPAQFAGLLDKAKSYAALKSSSPRMLDGLQVAEPEKKISLGNQVDSRIRRVLKDDSSNSVAFEVEITNRSPKDFLYDPWGLQVRVKDQVYDAVTEDASGIVKAQSSTTIFFVVNDPGSGQQNALALDKDFDLVIKAGTESKSEELTFSQPPGNYLTTATTVGPGGRDPEPSLAQGYGTDQPAQPAASAVKRAGSKKAAKKSEPKVESNAKESVAKTQKPLPKKLFGWL